MGQSLPQKRPWLAALLAALVTGFGHLYLRRVGRAIGWLVTSLGVSVLFVDPSAYDAFLAGTWTVGTLLAVAPMFLVVGLSVVDAYRLAQRQNAAARPSDDPDDDAVACPHCGNDLDPELEFCHWCTNSVEDVDRERPEETE
ncbi:zinc ribbon domain-containing protein (plasmid) [Natrinema zhouii]|uniref:DUF7575 domain-containing protein n=1 Tax=Natrinema zhouii TaxID=1710539 RepID=UPI001CFF5C47|nr:zinc ribbon domain-containing protein [Natrinema zhouii]UHQ98669.1 zinc ribbon domain-containing protein [Natrinema zhouii]